MTPPSTETPTKAATFEPKYFNPGAKKEAKQEHDGSVALRLNEKTTYVYSPSTILAVNVALATQRPLLVAGSPGTGKTTLAANVAGVKGWKFYQQVVTSRTKAQDLMWTFDALRRLSDAQARKPDGTSALAPREAYVEPQVLWWAFEPSSAEWRGASGPTPGVSRVDDPQAGVKSDCAVVLLDEIDKAEPDVPNDLLEMLDDERFEVKALEPALQVRGRRDRLLILLTTNGERELPAAFIRRCVVLKLEQPGADQLVRIAADRFGKEAPLHRHIANRLVELQKVALQQNLREPSTAEYLDALAASQDLGIDHLSPHWELLEQSLLWKRDQPPRPPVGPSTPTS